MKDEDTTHTETKKSIFINSSFVQCTQCILRGLNLSRKPYFLLDDFFCQSSFLAAPPINIRDLWVENFVSLLFWFSLVKNTNIQ